MPWAPHVTVATVLEREGRFLLVEEQTEDGIRFNQPAGHLERNESLVEAAVRESLEETGHHVAIEHLIGVYRWPHPQRDLVYLRFAFAGRVLSHDADRRLDEGILRAVWMTPDEIRATASRHRSLLILQCIDDYLAGRRFDLSLLRHYP